MSDTRNPTDAATADQTSALIGLTLSTFAIAPTRVAMAKAAEPARTGTDSNPVPTMPSAKRANAKEPARGRSASAVLDLLSRLPEEQVRTDGRT